MVFVDQYSTLAERKEEAEKITFFSHRSVEKLTNPELPTDYLIELRLT
jgi:hypothetical protein